MGWVNPRLGRLSLTSTWLAGGMTMIVGIDLGTTNSAVAYMAANGPRLIANALGEVLTPSVVGVETDGRLLLGRAARELQVTHPERCAGGFKRRMGTSWTVCLEGREFTPEELSGLVLRQLKEDAEVHLGQPVDQAVITVPAYFNEHQRKATIHAGEIAGLEVRRILNEPTAAAMAYGLHESAGEKVLLVLDLGGGTFDVSVVERFEGRIEVRASSGDSFLGGDDFTAALAAQVLQPRGLVYEQAELETPRLVARLMHLCEAAKRRLSVSEATEVRIPTAEGEIPEHDPAVTVTRHQFETWTARILARVDLPLRRVLGDANLAEADIDEVLLVGGATRMPAVAARIAARFGRPPRQRLNPDEVVALGAAVQAGLIDRQMAVQDLVVTDVAPFSLGIDTCKEFASEHRPGYFLPVICRNSTLPVSRVRRIVTVAPNQTHVKIKVYQGEGRRVDENLLLGELVVEGIPRGPAGQEVDVRFTYDANGLLEVEATILSTGAKVAQIITHHARGMSPDEVGRAVRQMQSLKVHPREETANRFLLRRAERVYQELPVREQERLSVLLDGFEEALELGEKDVIVRHREALEEFLATNDVNGVA
jgi:molecular chaperone HscC